MKLEEELLDLKSKIEQYKEKRIKAEGKLQALEKQMKEETDTTNLEKAEKILAQLQKEYLDLTDEINKSTKILRRKYNE